MLTVALAGLVTIAQVTPMPQMDQTPPAGTSGTPANSSPPAAMPATTAAPAAVPTMPGPTLQPAFQFSLTTLELMRRKGLITDVDYAQALSDMSDIGQNAAKAPTVVLGKFATTFYGFVEADFIHDSTRGFLDLAGNSGITSPANLDQYQNGQTIFGARNSRLGFRITSPSFWGFRPSALVEADFLGNQPANPPAFANGATGFKESSFWQNPTFRIRHMLLRLDNDIVSIWMGQTWELIGFQSSYHPNTVEIQGVPGQIYSRTPQIRLLHDFKFGDVATLEVAVAALRPPQMDSSIPDLQGGLKLSLDAYKGLQTVGATGTSMQPASIAVSGAYRWYTLATGSDGTKSPSETQVQGKAIAADIMLPIIAPAFELPVALTFVGEMAWGTGDSDIYTSLSGSVPANSPPGYTGAANSYPLSSQPGIDPGLAGWGTPPGGALQAETVDWRSFLVGLQLYLPPNDKIWLSANYSNIYSDNSADFSGKAEAQEWWWDVNLFADVTPAVRLGLEFARFHENFQDGVNMNARGANDERVQLSGFFIF